MKGGKNFYIRHFDTITGILLLILGMLAACGVIWWVESLTNVPPLGPAWLYAVIYNDSGKLEPLAYLIGLGGIMSLFLSTVNKRSAERAFGILLRDVVKFFFPCYNGIMFWFHGFFWIFGSYCCKKAFAMAAAACLVGIVLCSVYGCFVCMQLSEENLDELVLSYMHHRCRNTASPSSSTQIADSRKALHHFADYIYEQWQNNSALQLDRTGKPDLEGEMILGMLELINPALLPQEDPAKPTTLAGDMEDFFRSPHSPFCSDCKRFPCRRSLPCESDCAAYRNLHDAVQEYNMLWERLLRSEDARCRAKLAGKVLVAALIYESHTFMLLACGLLLHLRLSGPSIAAKLEDPGCFSSYIAPRLEFLAMIVDGYRDCFPRGVEKPPIHFAEAWGQLAWLAVAVLEWLLELRWPSDGEIETNINRFKIMLKSFVPDRDIMNGLMKQAVAYSLCAFALLSFERPEIMDEDIMSYVGAHQSVVMKLGAGL